MIFSKKFLKILSWTDTIFGGALFVLGALGGVYILLTPNYKPTQTVLDHFIAILIGLLMVISGYVLIELKKKKHKSVLGWLTIIFGAVQLFSVIVTITKAYEIQLTSIVLILGIIFGQITFMLLFLSGMAIRDIS